MSENEEYVQANWERVLVCDGSYHNYPRGTILFNWANHCFYEFATWAAAAEFTRERKEQIRQLEEEVVEIAEWCDYYHKHVMKAMIAAQDTPTLNRNNAAMLAVYARILTRLESALADLKRGLLNKGDSH